MNRRAGTVVKTGSSLDSEVITIPGEATIANNRLSIAADNLASGFFHLFLSDALLAQRLETIDRAFPLALFLTAVRGNVSWRYTGEKRL
jgi:hypothetical protein